MSVSRNWQEESSVADQKLGETDSFLPSSRMTLSPNTVISNFPVANRRERIFLIGLDRAFLSMAATPAKAHLPNLVSSPFQIKTPPYLNESFPREVPLLEDLHVDPEKQRLRSC
jgi:hypothetical protein